MASSHKQNLNFVVTKVNSYAKTLPISRPVIQNHFWPSSFLPPYLSKGKVTPLTRDEYFKGKFYSALINSLKVLLQNVVSCLEQS